MTEEELDSLATRWHVDARAPQTLKRRSSSAAGQAIRWLPVAALAVSGLVAVGVVSLSTKPLPAFADVERNLKAVQTAQWEEVTEGYDEKGKLVSQGISLVSIRRNPAAMMRVLTTPRKKGGASQSLFIEESMQTYEPVSGRHIIRLRNAEQRKTARSYVSFQLDSQIISPSKRAGTSTTPWKKQLLSDELIFEREHTNSVATFKAHFRERIWVNPKNLQVIRSEVVQDILVAPYGRYVERCRNIRYNPVLPDSVFRIVTRPDTKVIRQPPRSHYPASLSVQEKDTIRRLLRGTVSAWNRNDIAAFDRNWDFAFRSKTDLTPIYSASAQQKQWHLHMQNRTVWAAPQKAPELAKLLWTNAIGPDVLPKGKMLYIEGDGADFVISKQTGEWKIVEMYPEQKKR